ncbi:uncharacterized protein METZ01_LOCUS21537 [marine metagenome]|uniref:Uncharacterized protein n=1 Tax=marine metagenome TaxID=408172 RepID=A0A381PT89_9ZZZZ
MQRLVERVKLGPIGLLACWAIIP